MTKQVFAEDKTQKVEEETQELWAGELTTAARK